MEQGSVNPFRFANQQILKSLGILCSFKRKITRFFLEYITFAVQIQQDPLHGKLLQGPQRHLEKAVEMTPLGCLNQAQVPEVANLD